MVRVVGVRFKRSGKIYYFDPGKLEVPPGSSVVVETARGVEVGQVAIPPKFVPEDDVVKPLKEVIRVASDDDMVQMGNNRTQEKDAFQTGLQKIELHQLPMKLVDVEYTFDRSKLIFYFTADKRVDFRNLVKDLAGVFRTRIELRQIGVRDESKMLGGVGVCGRELCCSTWIGDFEPVSIRHAKDQELSLNPSRISGVCGRLKCCLRYESDIYRDIKDQLPKIGETVLTAQGTGKVVDVHLMKEAVTVRVGEGERVMVTASDLSEVQRQANKQQAAASEGKSGGRSRRGRRRRRRR